MKHGLAAAFVAAALVAAQAGPLVAQTPGTQMPGTQASGTSSAPEAAPGPEPKGDPRVERQRNSAAKLAGMVRFVDAGCPDAQPDYDRFKKVIAAMGVDLKDLEEGSLMIESLRYSDAYKKEPAESCRRALEHFGESGRTIPGLLTRKTADAKVPDGSAPDAKTPDAETPNAKGP